MVVLLLPPGRPRSSSPDLGLRGTAGGPQRSPAARPRKQAPRPVRLLRCRRRVPRPRGEVLIQGSVDVSERFLLLHEIHRGPREATQGTTFLALDRETGEEVHLTLLVGAEHQRQRFLAECDLARKLTSPLLRKLLTAGASRDMVYVAASRASAVDLSQVLAGGSLPPAPAGRILWRLCEALATLHGRGLVHGDVRPCHVLFTPAGELFLTGYVPSPFGGTLKDYRDEDPVHRYTPPEWSSAKLCHPTGDLYSLGLIAYELFVGHPLFPPGGLAETLELQARIQRGLDRGLPVDPAVTASVGKVLHALLQYDPTARAASAVELMPVLERALAGSGHKRPLAEVMRPRLAYPMAACRARLVDEAREELARSNPLGASASLRSFSELGPEPGSREAWAARELLVECLWATFEERHLVEAQRGRNEAVCVRVMRAAEGLGARSLASAARARVRSFAPGESGAVDEGTEAAARSALVTRLHGEPGNEEALLGLACREDALSCPEGTSPAAFRVELCRRHGLGRAAVVHQARELEAAGDPAAALRRLRELAGAALEEVEGLAVAPAVTSATGRAAGAGAPAEATARPVPASPPGAPAEATVPPVPAPPPGAGTSLPPGAPGSVPASPSEPALDVPALFARVDEHLAAGRLLAAADVLDELFVHDVLTRPEHHATVVAWVHEFLWQAMLPGPPDPARDTATEILMKVARAVGLETVLPICERVLLQHLPETGAEDRLQYLLDVAPDSIPILQAASRVARGHERDETWILYLTRAGERFLEVGEVGLATRMFTSIRAMDVSNAEAAAGLEKVDSLKKKENEARQKFAAVERTLEQAHMAATALIACKGFLALHPTYVPALEATVKLHVLDGNHTQAARIQLDLAKRALYREQHDEARRLFRSVLRNDFENEEALLYLTCLQPPPLDAPRETWRLRVSILKREKLWDAAIYQARKQLTGGAEDFPILALLAQLCRRAGKDPSPHLVAQGFLAREGGDARLARECLEAAIEEAGDRNAVIDELLQREGIQAITPVRELAAMKH